MLSCMVSVSAWGVSSLAQVFLSVKWGTGEEENLPHRSFERLIMKVLGKLRVNKLIHSFIYMFIKEKLLSAWHCAWC